MTDPPDRAATFAACIARITARVEKTFQPTAEWERQRQLEADVAARRLRLHVLERLEPPLDAVSFAGILHNTLTKTPAVLAVNRWLELPNAGAVLVLHGESGSGKTTAAASAAVNRSTSAWVSAPNLVAPYSALYGEDSDDWQRYRRAPLLVIDRLERLSRPKTHAVLMEALAVMVDQRRRRRTIITTRLSRSQLERNLDLAPLVELLADATRVTLPRLPGMKRSAPPPTPLEIVKPRE